MHYDLGYFDLKQRTLQWLDNPLGTSFTHVFDTSGKSVLIFGILVKPRNQKYFAGKFCKSEVYASRLIPEEGRWPSSPNVGMGCGGRGRRQACVLRRTKRCPRTAKSCGPGAAMLASSLWSDLQVTVTTSPLTGESTI
jgi:hypothetical protein